MCIGMGLSSQKDENEGGKNNSSVLNSKISICKLMRFKLSEC